VTVEARHVHKEGVHLWLLKMAAFVDTDSLVVGMALSSVLDLILEDQEASEVVIVDVGVVGAVPVGTGRQIQGFHVGTGCNIAADYART
jgi:hypothetical protein